MTGSGIKHPSLPNKGVNLTKHGVVQHASRASFIQSCFAGYARCKVNSLETNDAWIPQETL